ncbi:helix-turn-helix domain-containing protein [Actinomadura madurae]|uniref:helix-turn-helix domain-containing protein n=1 Tax=Actinomadura madurae TaxID=1993 RepID=UPI0020D2124B|nr:helix-turn-helix domain-containing protein [Actinomadura madurae]MCP9976905.1 helix-turn-helix domain-containing protein [Actinomadura madurae]MCQ0011600.1 helix-turn-helix domain-containing protein [Actinomadura madurae]MCQ0013089.1 helix-turn-helix domain-containing protein [Actinomadura madurae]
MTDERTEGTYHPKPGTQTVDRSVAVLRSFEGAARQTPTEIAHRLGLSVSTAHRIVHALHATGMLAQDPATERYFLGPTTAILGGSRWSGWAPPCCSPS